ncbi:MAG: hypothetical protein GY765_26170 [bacterium]|nr:hypothetical protein [bacterium]
MKQILIFILIVLLTSIAAARKLGVPAEILKPDSINISGDRLFIVQGAEIFVYSLPSMELKLKWGRQGEGPGEMMVTHLYLNRVCLLPDVVVADSFNKLAYFSHKGKLIREAIKKTPAEWIPFKDNFLVRTVDVKDKIQFQTLSLYNSKMEKIKELMRQRFIFQATVTPSVWDMQLDFITFGILDDKVFVEKSNDGFVIDVYDTAGKLLYTIKKPYEKIKCTPAYRKAVTDLLKSDSLLTAAIKESGGWENFRKSLDMKFPDTLPAISSIETADNKIYARTYKMKNGKVEHIVMDAKGTLLERFFVALPAQSLMSQMLGVKLSKISDGKLYYLAENEDDEQWEVHVIAPSGK